MLKYISISITSHNTTCPTELERHCVTLRFSFGMLHRALELNLFVQHQNTEVCLQQLPYGTASAAPQKTKEFSMNEAVPLLSDSMPLYRVL